MRIVNTATVSVDTTAGGTNLLTAAQCSTLNMVAVVVNPSVDIVLVDGGASGTVAASPFVCSAGVPTRIPHQAGQIKAISTSGTATVKVGIWCNP